MNIAIVGATGNVGRKTIEILEKKELSFDNLFLVASSNSAGKKISFNNITEYSLNEVAIAHTDIENRKTTGSVILKT